MLTNLKNLIRRIFVRLTGPILRDALSGEASVLRQELTGLRAQCQDTLNGEFSVLRQELAGLRAQYQDTMQEATVIRSLCQDISDRFPLTAAGQRENDLRYQDIMLLLNRLTPFTLAHSFSVQTDYPVAYESNDHRFPWGTKNDNTRSPRFVTACERHFPDQILHYMDLGCSGGGLVFDFLLRGHKAVGIEGSDFSQKAQRAEWRLLNQHNLFTADITKPFQVYSTQNVPFLVHIISAWELMEHIREEDLPYLFKNIYKHLLPGGFFVGSIALCDDIVNGISYHPTVKPKNWWAGKFIEFCLPFTNQHSFEFLDFCRGTGNGYFDPNFMFDPNKGFHFVARKLSN
jgi:SAM-dependent methyltransferase